MKNIKIDGCEVVDLVRTTTDGMNKKRLYKLLGEIRSSDSLCDIDIAHINDKKYHVKNGTKEGVMEVPENITKLGLLVFLNI